MSLIKARVISKKWDKENELYKFNIKFDSKKRKIMSIKLDDDSIKAGDLLIFEHKTKGNTLEFKYRA